jgi:uncharacterized protein (DUF2141 family)
VTRGKKELKAFNVTPDDIQFKHQVVLNEGKQGKGSVDISIQNSSNGYSKITTFSMKSKAVLINEGPSES